MLKINNLSKTYSKGKKAVDCLNLEIQAGEVIGFIGPNGAGKSTTMKMITGITLPDEGSILINGVDALKNSVESKRQFSFVPDQPQIFMNVRAIDYLNFIGDVYNISTEQRKRVVDDLASRFQIENNLTQQISSFSHGMKQKLMIIAALLANPKLFILDEPHVGLDPHSVRELKEIMKEHCENGGAVLFSSHVLDVVENIVDKVAIINRGKLEFFGTLKELKGNRSDSLEDIFLEMTK